MTPEEFMRVARLRGEEEVDAINAGPAGYGKLLRQGQAMRTQPFKPDTRPVPQSYTEWYRQGRERKGELTAPDILGTVVGETPGEVAFNAALGPFRLPVKLGGLGLSALLGSGEAEGALTPRTQIGKMGKIVLDRLRAGEGRTGDVGTVMESIQSHNLPLKSLKRRDEMMRASPEYAEAALYQHPRQLEKGMVQPARTLEAYERDWPTLPPTEEIVTAARAGEGKRGWYKGARETTEAMFPDPKEQTRWAFGTSALSPQTSVQSNAANMVPSYFAWKRAGMPTDDASIHRILAENVQSKPIIADRSTAERSLEQIRGLARQLGAPEEVVTRNPMALRLALSVYDQSGPEAAAEVLRASVLEAWRGNFGRAMRDEGLISGPKVNSFGSNLDPQNPYAGLHFTGDTWDAMLKGWLQKEKYTGQGFDPRRGDPGYSPGYTMSGAKTGAAADRLGWLPEEVQESTWSWAKPVGEGKSGIIVPENVLREVPDFQTLMRDPKLMQQMPGDVRARLENAPAPKRYPHTFQPSPAEVRHLENAQRRIEKIQALRRKMKLGEYD